MVLVQNDSSEPEKDICLTCGGIVIIQHEFGVMYHSDTAMDENHLARIA